MRKKWLIIRRNTSKRMIPLLVNLEITYFTLSKVLKKHVLSTMYGTINNSATSTNYLVKRQKILPIYGTVSI